MYVIYLHSLRHKLERERKQ